MGVSCILSALDAVPPPGVGEWKHLCHWIEAHSEGAGLCWLVDNVAEWMCSRRGALPGLLREGILNKGCVIIGQRCGRSVGYLKIHQFIHSLNLDARRLRTLPARLLRGWGGIE